MKAHSGWARVTVTAILSSTSTPGRGWVVTPSSGRLNSRKDPVPTVHKAWWEPEPLWNVAEHFPTGIRPPVHQTAYSSESYKWLQAHSEFHGCSIVTCEAASYLRQSFTYSWILLMSLPIMAVVDGRKLKKKHPFISFDVVLQTKRYTN
jgi:hypothetical protein